MEFILRQVDLDDLEWCIVFTGLVQFYFVEHTLSLFSFKRAIALAMSLAAIRSHVETLTSGFTTTLSCSAVMMGFHCASIALLLIIGSMIRAALCTLNQPRSYALRHCE